MSNLLEGGVNVEWSRIWLQCANTFHIKQPNLLPCWGGAKSMRIGMFIVLTDTHTAMNHYDACNAARCILSTSIRATVPLRSPHVSASTPAFWRGAVSNKMLFTHLEVEQASACVSSLITRDSPQQAAAAQNHTLVVVHTQHAIQRVCDTSRDSTGPR